MKQGINNLDLYIILEFCFYNIVIIFFIYYIAMALYLNGALQYSTFLGADFSFI